MQQIAVGGVDLDHFVAGGECALVALHATPSPCRRSPRSSAPSAPRSGRMRSATARPSASRRRHSRHRTRALPRHLRRRLATGVRELDAGHRALRSNERVDPLVVSGLTRRSRCPRRRVRSGPPVSRRWPRRSPGRRRHVPGHRGARDASRSGARRWRSTGTSGTPRCDCGTVTPRRVSGSKSRLTWLVNAASARAISPQRRRLSRSLLRVAVAAACRAWPR